jgi:hypothetical protein
MNYVISYSTKFLIDGPDEDTVHEVISSMGSDFLEENLKWSISEYEPPIIEHIGSSEEKDMDNPEASNKFYREFDKVQKEIYGTCYK